MREAPPPVRMGRRQLTVGLLSLGAGWLLRPLQVFAAAPSFSELVAHCECCVAGKSMAADALYLTLGGKRRIVTEHRFVVDEVLDGPASIGDELIVRTLGGQIGDYAQRVFGEAQLRRGERLVLFLSRAEPETFVVTGMDRGRFALSEDTDGVARLSKRAGVIYGPSRGALAASSAPEADIADALEGASLAQARALIASTRRSLRAR